jgi:hypothetical protein
MANWPVLVLAQKPPHPPYAVPVGDVIQVRVFGQYRKIGNVTADHDGCVRLVLADQLAHAAHFEQVGHDRADADDVIGIARQLVDEALLRGEIEQRAWRPEVGLNQH